LAKHYTYGPSSATRWLACPGSIKLGKGIEREESFYAAEGTRAHGVAEQAVRSNTDAECEDEEMRKAVQVYVDEIRAVEQSHDVILRHTETTRQHRTLEGIGGTCDHFAIYLEDEQMVLHIFDYKHGVGIPVDAWENKQLLSYFAIIESWYPGMIDKFRGTIVQPRAFAGDAIQSWECDVDRVREHEASVRKAMGEDHLKAGDHCRFCPAILICPEVEKHALQIAQTEFEVIRDDTAKLAELFELTPAIQTLLKKIPNAMMEKFRDGSGVPGYKVVAKRLSNRQWLWRDDKETLRALEELGVSRKLATEEKLKSPTQLEKELGDKKQAISAIVTRRETGFKVVPTSERGESVDVSSITEFERIEDDGSDD
jgi:hypothetical protein